MFDKLLFFICFVYKSKDWIVYVLLLFLNYLTEFLYYKIFKFFLLLNLSNFKLNNDLGSYLSIWKKNFDKKPQNIKKQY